MEELPDSDAAGRTEDDIGGESGDLHPDNDASPGYSFTRVMTVILFSYVVGIFGGVAFGLALLAACAIPWGWFMALFGERMGPWVVLVVGGGFASGAFIQLQLPASRTRFLFLFLGNPGFLVFLLTVVNTTYINLGYFPKDSPNEVLLWTALLAVAGTVTAVLGDRYAWKHKTRAGIA